MYIWTVHQTPPISGFESEKKPDGLNALLKKALLDQQFENAERIIRRANSEHADLAITPDILAIAVRESLLHFNQYDSGQYTSRLLKISEALDMPLDVEGFKEIAQNVFEERLADKDRYGTGEHLLAFLRYLTSLEIKIDISHEQFVGLLRVTLDQESTRSWANQVLTDALAHHAISRKDAVRLAYVEERSRVPYSPYGDKVDIGDIVVDGQAATQEALNLALKNGRVSPAETMLKYHEDWDAPWNPDLLRVNAADVQQGYSAMLRTGRPGMIDRMRSFAEVHLLPARAEKNDLLAGLSASIAENRSHRSHLPREGQYMIDMIQQAERNGMEIDLQRDVAPIMQHALDAALSGTGSQGSTGDILRLCGDNGIAIDETGPFERYLQKFFDEDDAYSAANVAMFADARGVRFNVEGKARTVLQHALDRYDIDALSALAPVMTLHGGGKDFEEIFSAFFLEQMRAAPAEAWDFFDTLLANDEHADIRTLILRIDLLALLDQLPQMSSQNVNVLQKVTRRKIQEVLGVSQSVLSSASKVPRLEG